MSAKWSVDGKSIISGDKNSIFLWNIETGHNINILWDNTDSVYSLCFSSDGSKIISGSF